jgi:hypothetical protein
MKLPFRRRTPATRGQALVEFALILPLLVLLLLLAIDFGRVFFGWVGLNNAARIAANEAGFHPTAWDATPNTSLQDIYRQQVIDDMQAINCAPPGGGTWDVGDIPDPEFIDITGTADPYELGDHTKVTLNCGFTFITPFLGNFVGNPLTVAAVAEFPVKGAEVLGLPVGGVVPTPTPGSCAEAIVPTLVGQPVSAARAAWTNAGFTGAFDPPSGSDDDTVTGQTTNPASGFGDCLVTSASVTVTHEPSCEMPQLVGLKSSAAEGPFRNPGGFTGTFTIDRPPSNDYDVGSQSLVGGQRYLCSSSVTVFK